MNFLLLRGLSREQRHWGSFPDTLCARIPDLRVHCLDLPGTGTESHRPGPTTVEAIAEDLRERWLALRDANPGEWGLLGMSLGGMVAMQWCADHPADFSRVVLCNTSAGNLSRPWSRLDPRVLPSLVRAMTFSDPVVRERLVLSAITCQLADLDGTAQAWASYQQDRPISRATVLRQLWAAIRFRAPERLEIPGLILSGGRDVLMKPSCPRLLAEHFGMPLQVHPEAGHELALDAPDWFADQMATWLEGGDFGSRRVA